MISLWLYGIKNACKRKTSLKKNLISKRKKKSIINFPFK